MRWPWQSANGDIALAFIAKLLDAIDRRGGPYDGYNGFPTFDDELKEMRAALFEMPEVKRWLQNRPPNPTT